MLSAEGKINSDERATSQTIALPATESAFNGSTYPDGDVIYLGEEESGIGLLSKIHADDLQDIGHEPVYSQSYAGSRCLRAGIRNCLRHSSGHGIGENSIPSPILDSVIILTNNSDNVKALEKEGIRVDERLSMLPGFGSSVRQKV